MKFYQEFSKYYDYIFPLQKEKFKFLADNASIDGDILDVATGTGDYALALAEAGYQVTGIDLSTEMIRLARTKAEVKDEEVEFKIEDMKNLSLVYKQKKFKFIYCIGNSLVHLDNLSEIKKVLQQFQQLLADDGRLVIQIVNYNRILTKQISSLPTISNQEKQVKLIRNYELVGDKVEFKTELLTPKGQFKNSVFLYPLTVEELQSSLKEAGFSSVNFYGGFNYEDYDSAESFPLIAKASN